MWLTWSLSDVRESITWSISGLSSISLPTSAKNEPVKMRVRSNLKQIPGIFFLYMGSRPSKTQGNYRAPTLYELSRT